MKWFRDNFAQLEKQAQEDGGENAYHALDMQAEKIPAGSDSLVVLPYFMGERSPVWDTNARGTIFGLSLTHTKAYVYRAFLEAVAYSLRHSMEATGEDLGVYILLTGLGTGLLTLEYIKKWQILDGKIIPNPEVHAKYNKYYTMYRKIYTDLKDDMRELSNI